MDEDIKTGFAHKTFHFRASVVRVGGCVPVVKAFVRINVSTLVFSATAIRAGAHCGFIDTSVH